MNGSTIYGTPKKDFEKETLEEGISNCHSAA